MVELQPIFKKAYWSLAAGGLVYVLFVCSLTFPDVQRFFLYANNLNPTLWQDVNQVEQFGFLNTQVQPFNLKTQDNETLYGWHLLPLHLCYENEQQLLENPPSGPAEDYTQTVAHNLLANNPNARLVVYFHGNAAHLASASRPKILSSLLALSTPSHPIHVFTIDYRGFGISTGSPTEEGVITDSVSLLNFLTAGPYKISPSRIVIAGQSLGTAVTAAVAERFAFGSPDPNAIQPAIKDAEPFAGVVLLAGFSNVPSLIKSYSIKGFTPPLLSPLIGYPSFQKWVIGHTADYWHTAKRVARLTGIDPAEPDASGLQYSQKGVDLTIIHALNDYEIPWYEGVRVWAAATGETVKDGPGSLVYEQIEPGRNAEVKVWNNKVPGKDGQDVLKKVRWERVKYGGHNHVAEFSAAGIAVLRAFNE